MSMLTTREIVVPFGPNRSFPSVLALLLATAACNAADSPAASATAPASAAAPSHRDDWEQVKRRLLEQFQKNTTVSGRVETHVFRRVSGGEVETQGGGTFDLKIGPEKTLVRMDMTNTSLRSGEDGVKQDTRTSMSISDGHAVHTLVELEAQRWNAFKVRHQGSDTFDVKEIVQFLEAEHNVKALEGADVDGTPTIVVEAEPKVVAQAMEIRRRTYFFAKNSGLLLQRLGYDASGNQREKFRILDMKLGQPIPDERFEFSTPEGVEIVDMTAQQDAIRAKAP